MQHAVDAKAHNADVAPRLHVDVAGALIECVLPQPVDDVDDVLVVGVDWRLVLPISTSCSKLPIPLRWSPFSAAPLIDFARL